MSQAPKVSVIIRSLNEELHIGKLLIGLEQQDFRDFEVILVDSGSSDRTVEIARKFNVKIVEIAKSEFSFGRSLNLGCAAARGEILLAASAHVYPTRRNWISRIIEPFSDPQVVLSYGRQVGNDATKFSEHQIFKAWFGEESTNRQRSHFCNNANCAVRRSAWLRLRYDETLTGLEDLAWAKEMQKTGGRLAYVADAEIVHVHDETYAGIRNRYRREAIAMKHIEPTIRFGAGELVTASVRNIASDAIEAFRQGRLSREVASILLFRLNQFWGTYVGHRQGGEVSEALKERFYYPAAQSSSSKEVSKCGAGQDRALEIDYAALLGAQSGSK
ncbi:glycosyltransferase [Stappia sp. F7233]|uniref:Glycosyltransferase n=1 Tax=Stappia albiluteola TaxID=2758565 RepID=A0A839AG83_9HYPH|nr:glycosyltransferase [Stappia albiluteola]MBA5778048.1 glycosyltransferase [Stappia albiluteola]